MSSTTVATAFTAFNADVVYILGLSTTIILGVLAALLGLGWAVRHARRYISGRKF